MNSRDLSDLLREWPYEPGRINVRRIIGDDDRPKLQIRIDLGVMQLEIEGRPDGERPHGFASLLDYHLDRLQRYIDDNGSSAGFVVNATDCAAVREEAVQYYHRYVGLFALRDFDAVIRDTSRNLELFDLCKAYGETEADRLMLEQFRPQVIVMRARSEAELALAEQRSKDALRAIERGLDDLRGVFEEQDRGDDFEEANEVQLLRGMRDVLVPKLPASQKAELRERLRAALDAENYELAAILRDELRMM